MKYWISLLICSLLCFSGCKRNPLKVDVSDSPVEMEIQRFEEDLFNLELDRFESELTGLKEKYRSFLPYFAYVINIGDPQSPGFSDLLKSFITDRINFEVYHKTMEVFPDISKLNRDLLKAFRYYHYHFPQKSIPDVYTFISGFNTSILVDTSILAIALDRYLGADFSYYERMAIPNYIRINMEPEKILSDCIYSWGSTEFTIHGPSDGDIANNVLNNLLYEGKLRYFVKAMIPDEEDYLIMGFTPEQLQWCRENEGAMWIHLVENELLFDTDHLTIRKLTGDAPFTSLFPRQSPGKAAVWLGWRIVQAYMERHPETTLSELMDNTNYQDILNQARYNPGL